MPSLVGSGVKFNKLNRTIMAAADADLPVLVLGESGTGKEMVARAVHFSGKRKEYPFLSIDCGTIPEHLAESELFGYAKGAFTGASIDKEGLFIAAKNGTVFLDEIGNTSPRLQSKLLRVLQEREVRPLGSNRTIPIRARIVAASNLDLQKSH